MVCHRTLVTLPGNVEAISRSPTNDPEAVAVLVSNQMRFTVLSPPRPLVMSARTSSPVCVGIVLRVTAITPALRNYAIAQLRNYAIGNERSTSPAGSPDLFAKRQRDQPTQAQCRAYEDAARQRRKETHVRDRACRPSRSWRRDRRRICQVGAIRITGGSERASWRTRVMPAVRVFAPRRSRLGPPCATKQKELRPQHLSAASLIALSPAGVNCPILIIPFLHSSNRLSIGIGATEGGNVWGNGSLQLDAPDCEIPNPGSRKRIYRFWY